MRTFFPNRFGTAAVLFCVFAVISYALRVVLLATTFAEIDCRLFVLAEMFLTGFLFDAVTFSYFMIPLVLYLIVVPECVFHRPGHRFFLYCIAFATTALLVFNAVAEYYFWDEFGTRYNFIAVDYLVYTREVAGNIWESYPIPAVFGGIGAVSGVLFLLVKPYLDASSGATSTLRQRVCTGILLLLLPCMSYLFVDTSLGRISGNAYVNSLAGNGIYSLFAAFRNNRLDYASFYITRNEPDVSRDLRILTGNENVAYCGAGIGEVPLLRPISKNGGEEKRRNVIIIMMESMSGKYLGSLGSHEELTPNLDELARRGMLFDNLYATGTRTVRGMEAALLSVPPSPGRSMIKRPGNEHLFTIGSVFRERGYENKFIYGGFGYFDNMNYFFHNNGFAVVDRTALSDDQITFENIWGVCDEDLMAKVIEEADKSYDTHKPFFSFVMTTSNHRPFTYPEGKVFVMPGTPHRPRKGGVKYADFAVGAFFKKAKSRPWFKNTLFVITADHCASSAGKTDLPPDKYRIPLIIYEPGSPRRGMVHTLCSQIDIGPTIFDLLNWEYTSRFFGTSILGMDPSQGRAFISTYQLLGYLKDDMLIVLKPKKRADRYRIDPVTGDMVKSACPERYVREAVAYFQGASSRFMPSAGGFVPLRPTLAQGL